MPGRLQRAAALLTGEGIAGDVSVAGHEEDVLVVAVPAVARSRLEGLAPRLKAIGFRYITLELSAPDEGSGAPTRT